MDEVFTYCKCKWVVYLATEKLADSGNSRNTIVGAGSYFCNRCILYLDKFTPKENKEFGKRKWVVTRPNLSIQVTDRTE